MSIDVIWENAMSPAEAERGKFLAIDTASLTGLGYPETGRGKYCVLTYNIAPASIISLSGVTIAVEEPLTVSVGNSTQLSAVTLVSAVPQVINFSPMVNTVEILNNDSTKSVYLLWGTTTISALTSQGLVLGGGAYYSIDRATTQLSLGSIENNINVRVFGHYEV